MKWAAALQSRGAADTYVSSKVRAAAASGAATAANIAAAEAFAAADFSDGNLGPQREVALTLQLPGLKGLATTSNILTDMN